MCLSVYWPLQLEQEHVNVLAITAKTVVAAAVVYVNVLAITAGAEACQCTGHYSKNRYSSSCCVCRCTGHCIRNRYSSCCCVCQCASYYVRSSNSRSRCVPQDTVLAQQQQQQQVSQQQRKCPGQPLTTPGRLTETTPPCRSNPFLNGLRPVAVSLPPSPAVSSSSSSSPSLSSFRAGATAASFAHSGKLPYAGLKSAFTPLGGVTGGSGHGGLHSAFSPHLHQLTALPGLHAADVIRSSFLQQQQQQHSSSHPPPPHPGGHHHHHHHHQHPPHGLGGPPGAELLTSAHHPLAAYTGLGGLAMAPSLPAMLAPPLAFHPYRLPLSRRALSPPSTRTPDKNSERSVLTDSDQVSDGWEEGSSPKELKESD